MQSYLVAVTLWVQRGMEEEFRIFEHNSLAIAARNGGRLLHAARLSEVALGDDAPYEFHLLEFGSEQDFRNFREDQESRALDESRERLIARAQLVAGKEIDIQIPH